MNISAYILQKDITIYYYKINKYYAQLFSYFVVIVEYHK